uniref:Olfactomedin-like protein 2A n=1 Tax=Lepisosteus oculatus TaxID=7918 RepID=W5N0M3_LEPOC|nr:PREDICTED: olfactomedin-like protein 2A isoform X1 [Lepisosteus oculatus]
MRVFLCVTTLSLLALTIDCSIAQQSSEQSNSLGGTEGQCGCRCLLRRPSLEQCRRSNEQGDWRHQSSLIQPLTSWGSKCKCHCEIVGYSPCENELKLERLKNKIPDIAKIKSTVKVLQQVIENADIRRLSSNTNRVITHIKSLEQVLRTHQMSEKALLKKLQGSLSQNALLYQNVSEAMRFLSREIYKVNGHLRHTVVMQPSITFNNHTADQQPVIIAPHNSVPDTDKSANQYTMSYNSKNPNNVTVHLNQLTPREKNQSSSTYEVTDQKKFTSPIPPQYGSEEDYSQKELVNTALENNCSGTLISVGLSETVAHFGSKEGAWFMDPWFPVGPIYVADKLFGSTLLEFKDLKALKQDNPSSPPHYLPCSYSGTGHAVYNGSFYYLKAFTQTLIRYSLEKRALAAWVQLYDLAVPRSSGSGVGWQGHNEVSLGVDESGLWAAYPSTSFGALLEDELVLARLDPVELVPLKDSVWKTGLQRPQYGLYFLSCGVLYCFHQGALHYAFDTYTQGWSPISLAFPNRTAYSHLTQLSYCPLRRALLGWDNATQVFYSLLFTQ